MEWIAITVCVLCGALIVWVHFHEAREHGATSEHIRAMQHARMLAAAMSDDSDEPGRRTDEVTRRVRHVVATVCEQAVYPEQVTIDPEQLCPTDDLVFDLGYGLDSLAFFDLRTSLEKEFAIRFSRREFDHIRTIADAIAAVQLKLAMAPGT